MGNIAVGLELSFSRLKLITLEQKKEGITIVSFDTENVTRGTTPEETLQSINFAVESILKRNKLNGKLGVSFPSHAIFTRQIKMLPQPDAQLYNTISFEINEYLPFPVNEAVWSYHKVNRAYNPGEEYDIIVVAAKYEVMEQVEQILGDLIYKVDVLQFAPLALYSYLRYEFADKKETFLVLDIGETNNDMIVVEEGKFWHRSLTLSGKDIIKLIVSKMGVSKEEARELKNGELSNELLQTISPFIKNLSTEINRSINFYKYTSKKAVVSEIKLCGSNAKIKNFAKLLQEASLIRTSIMNAPQTMYIHPAIEQTITEELPSLYPAIGLALQAAHLSDIAMDFSPYYVIEYKKFSKKKPIALIGVALLVVAVILAYFSFSKKTEILNQKVQNMATTVSNYNEWLQNYTANKTELNKLHLIDYIANNIYSKKDRILHILDALVHSIKSYNAVCRPEDKIYLVGFDYTTELLDKPLGNISQNTKKQEKKEEKEKATESIIQKQYIKKKNIIHKLFIALATKKPALLSQNFTDAPLREIAKNTQNEQDSYITKLIAMSNQTQKKIDEKSSLTVKCSSIVKEGTGREEPKKCSIPSLGNCIRDPNGFIIFKCENISLQDNDIDELIRIIEETGTKEGKQ